MFCAMTFGIARDKFNQTACQRARPKIVDIARGHVDDKRNGLAAIEVGLSYRRAMRENRC